MSKINDISVVKQQYATANNLDIRISIHDKYSRISWDLEIGYFQIIELIKGRKY